MTKKTLIFDFDGTLADSFALALDIAYEVTGATKLSAAEIERLRELPLTEVVRELRLPIFKIPKLLLVGRQMMHDRIREVQPFGGIEKVLRQLHDDGYRLLVMSSNSEQNVRAFLRSHDLEDLFAGVYGNASVLNKSTALKKVLKKHGLSPDECFYIGDEVRDVSAASRVGVDPVAVTWGFQARDALADYHPYAMADKPQDLVKIFEEN